MYAQIFTILNAHEGYRDAVGLDEFDMVKFYRADRVPQGTARPYSTMSLVSRVEDQNKEERGMYRVSIQIDHFGNEFSMVEVIDSQCFLALNRYSGTVEGMEILSIRGSGAMDGFNRDQEADYLTSEFTILINPN